MAKITLARILKIKNRLGGRLAEATTELQTYSVQVVQPLPSKAGDVGEPQLGPPEVDVKALSEKRLALRNAITTLKLILTEQNKPIQKAIFDLAELKGDIAFLAGLRTNHGKVVGGYGANTTTTYYHAFMRKAEVDAAKAKLEGDIDALQEQIDKHNHATLVEVDDAILALAK